MFEEYKKNLLKFYRIKKINRNLPDNLAPLGRERLRTACIDMFQKNNAQNDKDLMRSVFGPADTDEDQMRNIEKFDLDRFRPLISFLTKEGRNIRDDKLVKLFAWLIDFPPNEEWQELSDQEKERVFEDAAKKKKITKKTGGDKTIGPKTSQSTTRLFPNTYIVISCILLLSIGSISFIVWENWSTAVRMPKAGEKHMYWNGDHYEPIKEGEQKAGVTIIPLDIKTLQQQRKITIPDTLTKYSLGKVWYKGYGSNHEYFTLNGVYPTDTARTLKPLSNMILARHTSNYRYILTRLVWFLYAAIFVSLCGYGVSRMKRKVSVLE
ncbi:hypothetical protein EZ456_00895 [Pedobacter psychrodurus]|uniref:Uncharacterized protein n=1 Tax=Pedobacter psychrodurus TaxID=2530456 RepID=A0A4R0Q6B3_9SPHI|nr:hypothetical protein [Pedobacter psychrodurus]TCD29605.1 hypothetical protein EZ456_00895 [Pedobacter psychrodurus]